jgi:ATPase subunit of ABC transporter with duplicated ATPase domains
MLQASDLTKSHDGAPLFDGLSFVLGDGERAGLVGRNGVGKSTLLRLLAGVDRPDRGSAATAGRDRVGWLPQEALDAQTTFEALIGAGLGEVWSVRGELHALEARLERGDTSQATLVAYGHAQERFGALDGWALDARLDEARRALAIDHLDPRTPLARLSGGEQARVVLAGTLLSGPTVLLLDEPTNHLDGDGLRWLEAWLQAFDGTAIVVSHDRAFLDAVVGCVLELEGGGLTRYEGGYSDYRVQRERLRAKQALAYEAQEKRRRRLEADIATTRRQAQHTERTVSRAAAPTLKRKAKKVAKKAKARETRLRREFEGEHAVAAPVEPSVLRLRLEAHARGRRRVAALREVRSRGLRGVELTLHRGDRVAVTGPNGAGKTTLLQILGGVLVPSAGTVELAEQARLLPQTPLSLPTDERVVDWLRAQTKLDEGRARMLLGAFALDTAAVHRPLGRLSPGERARVHMAAMVASGAELLLLDEPTNHLDPETLEAVERALGTFAGTLVVVSHDRAFLDGIGVTRRLEVRDGSVVER